LINTTDSWECRPPAVTSVHNLFLAGDYVQTYTDLATMEGANEAARRAVNGLLSRAHSPAQRCMVRPLPDYLPLAPLRWWDSRRLRGGLPWVAGLSAQRVTWAFRQVAELDHTESPNQCLSSRMFGSSSARLVRKAGSGDQREGVA